MRSEQQGEVESGGEVPGRTVPAYDEDDEGSEGVPPAAHEGNDLVAGKPGPWPHGDLTGFTSYYGELVESDPEHWYFQVHQTPKFDAAGNKTGGFVRQVRAPFDMRDLACWVNEPGTFTVFLYGPRKKGRGMSFRDQVRGIDLSEAAIELARADRERETLAAQQVRDRRDEAAAAAEDEDDGDSAYGGDDGLGQELVGPRPMRTAPDYLARPGGAAPASDAAAAVMNRALDVVARSAADMRKFVQEQGDRKLDAIQGSLEAIAKAPPQPPPPADIGVAKMVELLQPLLAKALAPPPPPPPAVETSRGEVEALQQTIRQLQGDLSLLREQRATEVGDLRTAHLQALQSLRDEHAREREALRAERQRDLDNLRETQRTELDRVRGEGLERVRDVERRYEDRIKDMTGRHEQDLKVQRELLEQRVQGVERDLKEAERRSDELRADKERLRDELATARHEATTVKIEAKVDALQANNEASKLSNVVGMIGTLRDAAGQVGLLPAKGETTVTDTWGPRLVDLGERALNSEVLRDATRIIMTRMMGGGGGASNLPAEAEEVAAWQQMQAAMAAQRGGAMPGGWPGSTPGMPSAGGPFEQQPSVQQPSQPSSDAPAAPGPGTADAAPTGGAPDGNEAGVDALFIAQVIEAMEAAAEDEVPPEAFAQQFLSHIGLEPASARLMLQMRSNRDVLQMFNVAPDTLSPAARDYFFEVLDLIRG